MCCAQAIIVSCCGCFHGRTLAVISMSCDNEATQGFGPLLPGHLKVDFGDEAALEKIFKGLIKTSLWDDSPHFICNIPNVRSKYHSVFGSLYYANFLYSLIFIALELACFRYLRTLWELFVQFFDGQPLNGCRKRRSHSWISFGANSRRSWGALFTNYIFINVICVYLFSYAWVAMH